MITFLNFVRVMRPNNFQMFTSNKYVLLGHALTPHWATRIADDLKSAIIEPNFSPLSSSQLTSEMVLGAIRHESSKLNLRPAIIQQLVSKFHERNSFPESISTKVSKSMKEIISKMDTETTFDFIRALESLKNCREFLKTFRLLALGKTTSSQLVERLTLDEAKFLALQCGLDDLEDVAFPELLPPYAYLCQQLVVPNEGNVALNSALFVGYRPEKLSPFFQHMMKICTECLRYFNVADKTLISDTVVRVLFEHGICAEDADGKKIPVHSVFDHEFLEKLHCSSSEPEKYDIELSAYEAWKLGGCHGVPPKTVHPVGLQVQRELRNFDANDPSFEAIMLIQGWHVGCLEEVAHELLKCLPLTKARSRVDFSKHLFPELKKKERPKPT